MLYYPRLGVIYLKRHKPYVTTDQYGRVRRDYGNGPYLSVIKDKNGNHTEKSMTIKASDRAHLLKLAKPLSLGSFG